MAEDPVIIRTVAIVLFDGFTVLDAYGPIQAFASARTMRPDGSRQPYFKIFTVAAKPGPVPSGEGVATVADYAFADAPKFDILLVPGGFGTRTAVNDPAWLDELAAATARAAITTSVCTGSALLAKSGVLDGRPATSNKIAWDWVVQQGPRVKWQRKARWVDDGNMLTSSGVSAGMDMALSLIARLNGRDLAVSAARGMEYVWHEDPSNDPFA
jgi:transcriptional regulator GlxA family with amidase domain